MQQTGARLMLPEEIVQAAERFVIAVQDSLRESLPTRRLQEAPSGDATAYWTSHQNPMISTRAGRSRLRGRTARPVRRPNQSYGSHGAFVWTRTAALRIAGKDLRAVLSFII